MGLLDTSYESVLSSSPKRSDKVIPVSPVNVRGLLDAATMLPVAGDAISGGLAVSDYLKGDYGSAAMNALGILPFIGGAGMIKSVRPSKMGSLPEEVKALKTTGLGKSELWQNYGDRAGLINKNMDMTIYPLSSGDFALTHSPAWGNKSKGFYAIGDNPEELVNYSLNRVSKSDKAIQTAEEKQYAKSLAGMLEAEYGPVFSYAKSGRSESQYITHNPSGQKIRISGHDLPLGYVQSDLDIPSSISDKEKLKAIINFLK